MAFVAGIVEELAGLGPAAAGIKHGRRRLVGEQLGRCLQPFEQPLVHRAQQEGRVADPVGQRRAVEVNALPGVDLGLAIKRQLIGIFGDEHLGDGRLGRQPGLDQARRRGRLHDHFLAGPATIAGPAHHEHPELGRNDIETLRAIFPNQVQRAAATGAGRVLHR